LASNCIKNESSYVDKSKILEAPEAKKRLFYNFATENVSHF